MTEPVPNRANDESRKLDPEYINKVNGVYKLARRVHPEYFAEFGHEFTAKSTAPEQRFCKHCSQTYETLDNTGNPYLNAETTTCPNRIPGYERQEPVNGSKYNSFDERQPKQGRNRRQVPQDPSEY